MRQPQKGALLERGSTVLYTSISFSLLIAFSSLLFALYALRYWIKYLVLICNLVAGRAGRFLGLAGLILIAFYIYISLKSEVWLYCCLGLLLRMTYDL